MEEVIVGESFSDFSRLLSQIVDLDPQDQILWHFSYRIFIRRTQCALHLQKNHCLKSVQIRTRKNSVFGHISHSECSDWTKINDSDFVCGVDLKMLLLQFKTHWFSTHFGLWSIKGLLNVVIFFLKPEHFCFFAQMICNRFKSFERDPCLWISLRTTSQYFMKNCISLDVLLGKCPTTAPFFSWTWGYVVVVATEWWLFVRNCFQRHPKLGRLSNLKEVKSLNIIFDFKYRYYKRRNFFS